MTGSRLKKYSEQTAGSPDSLGYEEGLVRAGFVLTEKRSVIILRTTSTVLKKKGAMISFMLLSGDCTRWKACGSEAEFPKGPLWMGEGPSAFM